MFLGAVISIGKVLDERTIWLALSQTPGLIPGRLWKLIERLGSVQAVWEASPEVLVEAGLSRRAAQAIAALRNASMPSIPSIKNQGIRLITWTDQEYPKLLRHIADPPPVLYVRGTLVPADEVAVAIVGARWASTYGKIVAEVLAYELSRRGVTVVSGLARGIDGAAHRGALKGGGRTIGVLGCGVDVAYPPEHRSLMEEIARNGAVISELPCGTRPLAHHFPMRNRIISGLSLGVVVVEGTERSGALITADCALEQGREVFAVPGNVLAEKSRAPHKLIKQGAKAVERVEDILEELKISFPEPTKRAPEELASLEAKVLGCLSHEPKQIDAIIQECGLPPHLVASTLLDLEVKGLIRQLSGKLFLRLPS